MRVLSFIFILCDLALADDAVTAGVKKGFADGVSGVAILVGIVVIVLVAAILTQIIGRVVNKNSGAKQPQTKPKPQPKPEIKSETSVGFHQPSQKTESAKRAAVRENSAATRSAILGGTGYRAEQNGGVLVFEQSREGAGRLGEEKVYEILERLAEPKYVLRNVLLGDKGKSTEIDLILLHRTGIYVFESKNFAGEIIGDAISREWLHRNKRGEEETFFNPIQQNEGHINKLRYFLSSSLGGRYEQIHCFSVIVFPDDLRVSVGKPEPYSKCRFMRFGCLEREFREFSAKNKPTFNEKEMREAYYELSNYANASGAAMAAHVDSVKGKQRRKVN